MEKQKQALRQLQNYARQPLERLKYVEIQVQEIFPHSRFQGLSASLLKVTLLPVGLGQRQSTNWESRISVYWVEISIAAGLFLTVRNVVARSLSAEFTPVLVSWARYTFNLPFSLTAVLLLYSQDGLPTFSVSYYGYCFATGIAQILASIALISAFQHTNFAKAIVLHKLEVLFTAVIGALFFNELPTMHGWAGIVVCAVGVIFINLAKQRFTLGWKEAYRFDLGSLLAFTCAFFLVLASFLLKGATTEFALFNPQFGASRFEAAVYAVFHTTFMEVIMLTPVVWVSRYRELEKVPGHMGQLSLLGMTSFCGSICAFWSYSITLVVYAKAVAQFEAVAAIFLGVFFWQEKNMSRQIPGLAFVLIGIFIILLG